MNLMPKRLTGLAPQQAISLQRTPLIAKKAPQQETVLPIGTLVYVATKEEDPKDVGHRRATDLWWTHNQYSILRWVLEPGQPMLHRFLETWIHQITT